MCTINIARISGNGQVTHSSGNNISHEKKVKMYIVHHFFLRRVRIRARVRARSDIRAYGKLSLEQTVNVRFDGSTIKLKYHELSEIIKMVLLT